MLKPYLSRLIAGARVTLPVGIAFLSAAAAHAQLANVPSTMNTPYLLRGPNGQCMQPYSSGGGPPYGLGRQTCDPTSIGQRFYVLQVNSDDDAILPSNSVNPPPPSPPKVTQARIVSAELLDRFGAYGDYFLWTVQSSANHYVMLHSAATASEWGETTLNLVQSSSALAGWTTVATEGQTFPLAGRRTVRFGADNKWIVKNVDGSKLPLKPGAQGTCTATFFGGNPVNLAKHCDIYDDPGASGPYSVVIYDNSTSHFCIGPSIGDSIVPHTWIGVPCNTPAETWTLIPVSTYIQ